MLDLHYKNQFHVRLASNVNSVTSLIHFYFFLLSFIFRFEIVKILVVKEEKKTAIEYIKFTTLYFVN